MHTCPCCCGEGTFIVEEDGHDVSSPCYHCQMTGKIPDEQRNADLIESLAYTLAENIVDSWNISLTKDDAEGVAFLAAEYGISERQYIDDRLYKEAQEIMGELLQLKPATLKSLLSLINKKA